MEWFQAGNLEQTTDTDGCGRMTCKTGSLRVDHYYNRWCLIDNLQLYTEDHLPMAYTATKLYCNTAKKWTNYSLDGSTVGGTQINDIFHANCVLPKSERLFDISYHRILADNKPTVEEINFCPLRSPKRTHKHIILTPLLQHVKSASLLRRRNCRSYRFPSVLDTFSILFVADYLLFEHHSIVGNPLQRERIVLWNFLQQRIRSLC